MYYLVNPTRDLILGPCHTPEEAKVMRAILEYPKEWVLMRVVE